MMAHASLHETLYKWWLRHQISNDATSLKVHDAIFGTSDLDGIVMMVAIPKLVDVACDGLGDQGCALTGDGEAVVCWLPEPPGTLGWMGVYGAISVLILWTGWTTGGTGLLGATGGRVSVTLSTSV